MSKFFWIQTRNTIALQSGIRSMINGDKWCNFFFRWVFLHVTDRYKFRRRSRPEFDGLVANLYAYHPRYSAVIYAHWEESNVTWLIERIVETNIISADVSVACINNVNCLSRDSIQSENFSLIFFINWVKIKTWFSHCLILT